MNLVASKTFALDKCANLLKFLLSLWIVEFNSLNSKKLTDFVFALPVIGIL